MAITLDGIFVNGQKATFRPEDILTGDASAYTEEIGTAVEAWMEENVTGGEQVTDTTLTLPGVPADAEVTGNKIDELKEDLSDVKNIVFEKVYVIDATDENTYDSDINVRIPHLYNFEIGRKYFLEVQVVSATFANATNAIMADTSRATNDSTMYLNTTLLRIDNSSSHAINNGDVYSAEFIAVQGDVNILMRYKFVAGTQTIKVKCYALDSIISTIETDLNDVKSQVYSENIVINSTDVNTYTETGIPRFAHEYDFVVGRNYRLEVTVNQSDFQEGVSNALLADMSKTQGIGVTNLGQTLLRIDAPINSGDVFTREFTALSGEINILMRYKVAVGTLDVSVKCYELVDVNDKLNDLSSRIDKNANLIINSRMQMGAHRGAENFAPPNSVAAYEIAGRMGFPWAWLAQIRWSADNTLYVMHDEDVSITTNGTGNISELTDEYIDGLLCNKISGYDYSQFSNDDLRVPTLEKVIQICLRYGMKMCFRIEPFPNQIETERHQQIWDNFETLVKAYGISNDYCCYSGYNYAEMTRCITLFGEDAELCPYLGSSISSAQDVVNWFNNITSVTVKRKSILLYADNITLEDVKLLHTNNIKVYAFTNGSVPTQETMETLASWGVDILQNPKYARIPTV